ncbi:MAG: manganese-dependent inorganic pyrophosphatase [Candidatus Pacebacteria bacterium]|nr:manganese-dependent inorganic pyrophosphatase [Candidatus Paceibacterota bacterium]
MKDYNDWNRLKIEIDKVIEGELKHAILEREIWWCSLGLNVGDEQNGVNSLYERPVLVLKKFNKRVCLVLPITTKVKEGIFYYTIYFKGDTYSILLSQIRLISTKRFLRKIRSVESGEFRSIKDALIRLIMGVVPKGLNTKPLCQTTKFLYDVRIMTTIKVFGHISPDTDATSCAIIWAWYLNTHTTHKAEAYVLGELNKETKFVLGRWRQTEPTLLEKVDAEDKVVIVDTNNPQELLSGVNEADILQIIDHHKLIGGLMTKGPIEMTIRPVASTATVMHDLMGTHAETMPEDIAGVMLSCILSDTLEFRSPTTTPHDKAIAEKLAARLGLNITEYANEMFKAKSDVSDFTDIGLIHLDSKKFEVGDKNIRVSVVETTDPASVLVRKEGIVKAIGEVIAQDGDIDDVLFFVVDILREEATVFTYNDFLKGVISASFGVQVDGDTEVLPGIVSRKKQIIPALKLA